MREFRRILSVDTKHLNTSHTETCLIMIDQPRPFLPGFPVSPQCKQSLIIRRCAGSIFVVLGEMSSIYEFIGKRIMSHLGSNLHEVNRRDMVARPQYPGSHKVLHFLANTSSVLFANVGFNGGDTEGASRIRRLTTYGDSRDNGMTKSSTLRNDCQEGWWFTARPPTFTIRKLEGGIVSADRGGCLR